MSSPLPPDPYVALGVPKDADLAQIRTAHRKLVLKHHPDRIKGDDVQEKDRAKNEFQKAQQAYEILSDASKRARYDDQVKQAELHRERLIQMASRPRAASTQTTPGSVFVRSRETRKDGHVYEERVPSGSYFDARDRFDEPLSNSSPRKRDPSWEKEKKPAPPKPVERKERPRMAAPVGGIPIAMAFNLKSKATAAKERVREKDTHAKSQEFRDREKRSARSDKQSHRRTAFAEEMESDSDSSTVRQEFGSRSTRHSPHRMPESEPIRSRPPPPRRGAWEDDEDSLDEDRRHRKWEDYHRTSMDYIAESQKRPNSQRNNSADIYTYWNGDRRSGSDTEKQSANPRRTQANSSKQRPPMPGQTSAPSNLRGYADVDERIPQRSRTTSHATEQRSMPSFARSQTMPMPTPTPKSTRDTAPTKGSKLKHSETQDSGYYSSSNAYSPDMKGESSPSSRENSRRKDTGSTKYQIVEPDQSNDNASYIKILSSDDERGHRRYASPERERNRMDRERPHARDRPIRADSYDSRPRPARGPSSASHARSDLRHEAPSPRGSPPHRGGKEYLFGEYSADDYQYARPPNVSTASYRPPTTANYNIPKRHDEDAYPGSTFRKGLHQPHVRHTSAQM